MINGQRNLVNRSYRRLL